MTAVYYHSHKKRKVFSFLMTMVVVGNDRALVHNDNDDSI